MDPFYSFLQVKCAACQEPLIRIAQSETDDRVVCPICFAVGDYERVIKQGNHRKEVQPITREFNPHLRGIGKMYH